MIKDISKPITIDQVAELSARVIQEVEKAVVGKHNVLNLMMAAFLSSGGHILLEDYPGLAKTLIANSFAAALGLEFNRIQFTPDLLPGDITGGYVFDSNQNLFQLRKGPLFANILLADEINRASPKTQSALLEAMQVYVDPDVRSYIVALVAGTRHYRQVVVGVSPRGSLALLKLSLAWAAIQGRDFVIPDDVKQFTQPALAHRLLLDPSLWGSKKTENAVIDGVVASIPVPVIQAAHE